MEIPLPDGEMQMQAGAGVIGIAVTENAPSGLRPGHSAPNA